MAMIPHGASQLVIVVIVLMGKGQQSWCISGLWVENLML